MPAKQIIASKSIEIVFNSPSQEKNGEFKITGRRPTSVLKYGNYSPQGNHVTAYHLIELGLIRILNDLSFDEEKSLLKLENRESLRNRRKKLYDYVSAIAIIDSERANNLYNAFDKILKEYNSNRIKKTLIRREIETQRNTSDQEIYNLVLDSIKIKYNDNGKFMMEVFKKISATILTFYNKIKNTSFHEIKIYKPLSDEGARIKEFNNLNELVAWSKKANKQHVNSSVYATKTQLIVNSMLNLIHYPEIDNQEALEEHKQYNITCHGGLTRARNNSKETLIEILTRHIHIFFSVYPEIKEYFPKEIITAVNNDFINNFLKKNWRSFADEDNKNEIVEIITNHLYKYQTDFNSLCYRSPEQRYPLDSSDDEDNSNLIRAKFRSSEQELKDNFLMQFKSSQLTVPPAWKNSNFPTYSDRPRLSSPSNRLRCYSR